MFQQGLEMKSEVEGSDHYALSVEPWAQGDKSCRKMEPVTCAPRFCFVAQCCYPGFI